MFCALVRRILQFVRFRYINAVILQVFLKADHTSQPTPIQPVGKTRFVTGLAVSPNGAWLVVAFTWLQSSLIMSWAGHVSLL